MSEQLKAITTGSKTKLHAQKTRLKMTQDKIT